MKPINLITLFTTPFNNAAQIQQTGFKGSNISTFRPSNFEHSRDNFVSSPLTPKLDDAKTLEIIAKSNPRIMQLLNENGIKLSVNTKALADLKKGHMSETRVIAAKICSNLDESLRQNVNMQNIQQAAMLHDYGKVLIPEKILNKESALNPYEKKIMQLHSELGYELLKQQGVNKNVLNLIKYHHQKPDGSGYPAITDDFEYDINAQILHAADVFSALTENRCYHNACSYSKAIETMQEEVDKGNISQGVFDALKKAYNL